LGCRRKWVLEVSFRVSSRARQVLMWPSRVGSGTGAASFSFRRASRTVGRWPFPCPGCPGPALDAETAPAVPHAPSSRCFPSEDTPARLPPPSARDRSHSLSWAPLLEFFKDHPSTDIPVCVHARFPEVRVCHTRTCSTLVVLPDFGGLLRTRLAGLLRPATGHGVHLVSSRPPTVADDRPSSEMFLPFEALRRDSGSPVARSPSSASLVRGDRSHRFPRPRGFVPSRSSLALHCCSASTSSHGVSLDPGLHRIPYRCRRVPLVSQVPGALASGFSRTAAAVHSARHLPAPTLAEGSRGARDGNRVSHGSGEPPCEGSPSARPKSRWRRPSSF